MIITTKAENANVITHAGVFHADEVIATVILKKCLGDITVCRTFKVPEEGLSDDVIVYDVGFGKYDHHQKGGNGSRENGVPYAAAGLIWKDYGHRVVANTCNPDLVWNLIDRDLIQGVDAMDNGKMPKADYPAQDMSFYHTISLFNHNWDDLGLDENVSFAKALDFAETVFDNVLAKAVSTAKAKDIVNQAIEQAKEHVMVLDQSVPPWLWQEFIFSSESNKADNVQFVVFPSKRGGYNWQCVPDTFGGFGQRKPVPTEWKGLHDLELQEVTGVATASFCHPAGFIGGAETIEDAIELARIAVEA